MFVVAVVLALFIIVPSASVSNSNETVLVPAESVPPVNVNAPPLPSELSPSPAVGVVNVLFAVAEAVANVIQLLELPTDEPEIPSLAFDCETAVTVNEDSQYSAEIATDYVVFSNDKVDVLVGGAYGQTFETLNDYDYTLGYVRATAPLGAANLFAQVNYLNSDSVDGTAGDWEATTDFGVVLSF